MSMSFDAVKPGLRLADQVASALEKEIRSGRLAPGERLPTEAGLVQQFGVSRTVIREAVSQLKSRGMVDARQGSGVYVRAPSQFEPLNFEPAVAASREAVLQIVEVRRALEAEVADLAARRRTDGDLVAIRQALKAIENAVAAGGDGVDEDVRFHHAIAQAAANPYLMRTLDYLAQFLRGATRVTRANEARRNDFRQAVLQEHEKVVAAIEAADPAAARRAAARHMANAAARIEQADPNFWAADGARLASELVGRLPP